MCMLIEGNGIDIAIDITFPGTVLMLPRGVYMSNYSWTAFIIVTGEQLPPGAHY